MTQKFVSWGGFKNAVAARPLEQQPKLRQKREGYVASPKDRRRKAKTERLIQQNVRLTKEERARFKKAAERHGLTLGELVMRMLDMFEQAEGARA